jgi:hypothetical protein
MIRTGTGLFLIQETACTDERMNNIAVIMHFVCGTHPNEGVPLITRCVQLEDLAVDCRIHRACSPMDIGVPFRRVIFSNQDKLSI